MLAQEAQCANEEVALLEKVIAQDVDRSEGEPPRIRRGVAKDRTVSITDPDMRHGRKSSGHTYNGHKAHVAVDMDSGIITAVEMGSPGQADGGRVESLLDKSAESTAQAVVQAVGDSAYSSREALRQAEGAGVELKTALRPISGRS